MKSRIAAILFAFFLGGIGIHHFYLGNTGKGFLYLLFCWTLIPALIAFIEFILFLVMSDEEFNLKYNKGTGLTPSSGIHYTEELNRLHDLKVKGVISQQEFDLQKSKIIK